MVESGPTLFDGSPDRPSGVIRYMGSKRSLAPKISDIIRTRHPGYTIADAFAGTCAIGVSLAPRAAVFTNDIHAYAHAIAQALLVAKGNPPTAVDTMALLKEEYMRNLSTLHVALGDMLEEERSCIRGADVRNGWMRFREMTIKRQAEFNPERLGSLGSRSAYAAGMIAEPYALCTLLFSHAYFGLEQATEIDSIQRAIDAVGGIHGDFYRLALLQSASACAASPGHFAQFLVPRDETNTKYIARIRRRSPLRRFLESVSKLSLPDCKERASNRAFQMDALTFVRHLGRYYRNRDFVIYADPPYSRAQYSRYYHVLETLTKYDYPTADCKGRYRPDRESTSFSRITSAANAMNELVKASAIAKYPLFLSYPTNGLVYRAGSDVMSILAEHYPKVSREVAVPLAHSTMGGGPGAASIDVIEEVYYATF
jgi:adenine-specific DNA-methyltransferase